MPTVIRTVLFPEEAVRPAEVVEAAREEGFSRSMVYRARRSLGELVVEVGMNARDPRKRWRVGEESSEVSRQ